MERVLTWIRENPQISGVTMGTVILTVLLGFFAWQMSRAGLSLRPLIFFGGFFALIAGPQAFVHLLDGLASRRARVPVEATDSSVGSVAATGAPKPVRWERVFGPDADPSLITDPRRGLGAVFSEAEDAKISFQANGQSALAARFDSRAAAARSRDLYRHFFGMTGGWGSDADGWTARRNGVGDWAHVIAVGSEVYAWTGADEATVLSAREHALGPVRRPAASNSTEMAQPVSSRLRANVPFMVTFVSLNLLGAVFWFFKGSAWSARQAPTGDVIAASVTQLRDDLVALNTTTSPIRVTLRPDGQVQIDWAYVDQRWFDLMRLRALKRTHRLVLSLDEKDHTVRVREYWSAFDASAGVGGGDLNWQMRSGMSFFDVETRKVLGVELDRSGAPTGELLPGFRFSVTEMKQPVIERVTAAGWTWQPVMWNAPAAFRWLTE